jgi:hypothetical protein
MSQHGAVSLVELIEARRIIPEYGGEKAGLDPFLERGTQSDVAAPTRMARLAAAEVARRPRRLHAHAGFQMPVRSRMS